MKIGIAVVRGHHTSAAAGVALGEIFQRELFRRHPAAEHQSAISIIGNDVIARLHLRGDGRERFVPHSRNMKMAFALPDEILLAQIRVPALQNEREETQLIFFGKLRHTMSILQLQLRLDNRVN